MTVLFCCHPERSEGSVSIGAEMLRGVYTERSDVLSIAMRPNCHGGLQAASHRSNYDTLTFASSTKKEDVTQLEEVVAPKTSITV